MRKIFRLGIELEVVMATKTNEINQSQPARGKGERKVKGSEIR